MGLDISVYRNLKPTEKPDEEDYCSEVSVVHISNIADFASRADHLVDGAYYAGDYVMGFRAGSYSGYGDWREKLAKLAGYSALTTSGSRHVHSEGAWQAISGPFWELINFADNEGIIGPITSAKLARDFAEFQEKADAVAADDSWFTAMYKQWRAAFEAAADGGCVSFH